MNQSAYRIKSPTLEQLEKDGEEFGAEEIDGNLSLKRESLFNRSLKNSPKLVSKQENLPAEILKMSSLTITETNQSQSHQSQASIKDKNTLLTENKH